MRKLIFVCLILLMMLPFASASIFSDAIHIARIRLGEWGLISSGNPMDSYVYVYNENAENPVTDGKVSVRVMDADVYDSSGGMTIRHDTGRSESFVTDLDDAAKGEHVVKVTFTAADGVRKTKYRFVDIE